MLLNKDHAFQPEARKEAERRVERLQARIGQVNDADFILELCRITALADNGHTAAYWPREAGAPIFFQPFGNRFFVLRAEPGFQDLLGAELISIDGHAAGQVLSAERTLHGGLPAWRDQKGVGLLVRFDLLHSLGLSKAPDGATYRLRMPDGKITERHLVLTAPSSNRLALPLPDKASWAFQDPDKPFRWRDAPELDAIVVQLRSNLDGKDQKIADFLAQAEAGRAELGRRNIVLDMRWNGGGNFLLTRDFLISWPTKAPGQFYVLEGPGTFSAGIAGVAFLKQAGGARVTLVGEPVGDRLNFFAEGAGGPLPHSKLEVFPATMRDDFTSGCRGYTDCFPSVAQPGAKTGAPQEIETMLDGSYRRIPLELPTLEPDVIAPLAIGDYLSGGDAGMEAIWHLVAGHKPTAT